ncbi:peptidase E [Georgenia sp. EYE_87]|uniref:Type 1 glutamine amidotransferase-like domain-containing protein n=1 Tax=Georgenia sp. EYE_87 TaxID=2853448 RepID=UPI002004B1AA|nr:peptidase E [Georgenia sp. EYE_87]MCK6211960.1 peptidase E [Georgenia sp. EYE_87]
MPADAPTIVATSGGYVPGRRTERAFGPLVHHAVELAGVSGRAPRVGYLGTAAGDQRWAIAERHEAARVAGFELNPLRLFTMPNVDDIEGFLLAQDVVWVDGGSVANLLAVWRVHGLDEIFRRVWQAGVVLAGTSAGSICWHTSGTTDSFGPELRAVHGGLGLVPFANGVHHDSEERRRPLVHDLVASGELGTTYCTDDGVGLVYRDTELVGAVTERRGSGAYVVTRGDSGDAVEERIEPRTLPGV